MKVLVLHDEQGNILSLGVPDREFGGQVSLLPEAGQQVTEVDFPSIKEAIDEEAHVQPLLDILQYHRLELGDKEPKLVRK